MGVFTRLGSIARYQPSSSGQRPGIVSGSREPSEMLTVCSIWAEVYKDFGLSEDEILGYFSGPAFQAWQRMGNVHGSWERNVTREWIGRFSAQR